MSQTPGAYRDELEAARARNEALEEENARLRRDLAPVAQPESGEAPPPPAEDSELAAFRARTLDTLDRVATEAGPPPAPAPDPPAHPPVHPPRPPAPRARTTRSGSGRGADANRTAAVSGHAPMDSRATRVRMGSPPKEQSEDPAWAG